MDISNRGIILSENVDIEWLRSLNPQYFNDYIKFVIDVDNNRICVGMEIHRDCEITLGSSLTSIYGGNLYFDGHIVYESTLNIPHNISQKGFRGNPRIIVDPETTEMLDVILKSWINL